MSLKTECLKAARADAIPEGECGLWNVKKTHLPKKILARNNDRIAMVPAGIYTALLRLTDSTLHIGGELVMNDIPDELNTHLIFMLRAHEEVLITGLGLGCVLRGCLVNPAVKKIVVLEREPDVIKLVAPYLPRDRFEIIETEAEGWCANTTRTFDCAWHDLWTDEEAGEEHLIIKHASLVSAMSAKVKFQGAWAWPRCYRRLWAQAARVI
jgi:hypothetical protein